MPAIPNRYSYLMLDPLPPSLVDAALHEYGSIEGPGTTNNPKIIGWADEVAKAMPTNYTNWAADWYNKDSISWCGLFIAICAARSANGNKARLPVANYLSALAWAAFGIAVKWRDASGLLLENIFVGDVGVFVREGGGHVAIIVGVTVDGKYLVCLGGNQDNAVSIKQVAVSRLYAVRRPPYKVRPAGARHVRVTSTGIASTNEA